MQRMTPMASLEQLREEFNGRVEWMRRMVSPFFRRLGPEAREEAIENTLGLAWLYLYRLHGQGRSEEVTIKQVLWYAIKGTRGGRTPQGQGGRISKDVLNYARRGRVRIEHIDVNVFMGRNDSIPEAVALAMDWPEFLKTLTDRQRKILWDILYSPLNNQGIAAKWGLTPGRVSQMRVRIVELYQQFVSD